MFRLIVFLLILFSFSRIMGQSTYLDNFGSVSYANNDGTSSFSSNWTEAGDDNSASSGYIRVTGGELRMNYIWSENIRRTADLSAATSATLSFDWRTVSLTATQRLAIQISSTGGAPYTTLGYLTGSTSGTFSQDISAFMSANTTIRFSSIDSDWGSADYAYLDDILITATIGGDVDGDGIPDATDIDDDNDGMTDEEEYCTTVNATFLLSQDVGSRSVVVNHTDTGYLRLDFSSMDNSFQLDINGTTVHPSIMEFENGAIGAGEEYFVFQSGGAFISAPWVANTNGLPRLRLIVDESGTAALYGTRTSTSTSLELMQAQAATPFNTINWVSGANNVFTVINQSGPGPEGFTGELFASALCDNDGDGIINSEDLDSDNDGIYDIVESGVLNQVGVNDANNDGVVDGAAATFGNNGLFSGIEDNDFTYANLTYTISDSDSDGIYDPYEIDADNDTCNDVDEAGYTDSNNDGILGALPTVIDSNGLVTGTSVVDGYTNPNDNDSNSTYDFQEETPTPSITLQPINQTSFAGDSVLFSLTGIDIGTYQWQVSSNGGVSYSDLANNAIYSGVNTDELTINPAGFPMNLNQYRVVLSSNPTLLCPRTLTSNHAVLTVKVKTVITNRRITYRVNKN